MNTSRRAEARNKIPSLRARTRSQAAQTVKHANDSDSDAPAQPSPAQSAQSAQKRKKEVSLPSSAPIGITLEEIKSMKRRRVNPPPTIHQLPVYSNLLQATRDGEDEPTRRLLDAIGSVINPLYQFVNLVVGFLADTSPEKYWLGSDIVARAGRDTLTEPVTQQQPLNTFQMPIGVRRVEGGDVQAAPAAAPEKEEVAQPAAPAVATPAPAALTVTVPPQQPQQQGFRGLRPNSPAARVLQNMLETGRVNSDSLRAWRLLFFNETQGLSAATAGMLGTEPVRMDMKNAILSTLVSPIMVAGIADAMASIHNVARKTWVTDMQLIMAPYNVRNRFAKLVAAHILETKRNNQNFSNTGKTLQAQQKISTLVYLFTTLSDAGDGLYFDIKGSITGQQDVQPAYRSSRSSQSQQLFPQLAHSRRMHAH